MSKKLINIVLDLETLGVMPNACIIQIGATIPQFDIKHIADCPTSFESTISYEQCNFMIKQGVVTQNDIAMKWWETQQSRKEVFCGQSTYLEALEQFILWVNWIKSSGSDVAIWGNGSDFDNVILKHSLEIFNLHENLSFRNNRCFRTVKNIFSLEKVIRYADHREHTALGDAKHEARLLNLMYEKYELLREVL
jgi:hypothetical protein